MKNLLSFSLLLLLSLAGCKKQKSTLQLPPETQEGKFTIGFKVDGKIYTAKGKGGLLSSEHIYYGLISTNNSIFISAANTSDLKPKFHLALSINYKGRPEVYQIKTYPYEGQFIDGANGNMPMGSNTFTTTDVYSGTVNIKYFNGQFPSINGTILAGTFEMDAVNGEGKVIHITEGRFDIGY